MIHHGDLFDVLPTLPAQSVHCVVTSPPYWGLRDYGVEGQLGLEPTPEAYVARMVEAFAEVHRVLRDDGTLWLNMGDAYAASGKGGGGGSIDEAYGTVRVGSQHRGAPSGYKPKDLVGVPWMLAFALRSWGWYLRAEIVWAKGVSFCDAYAGSVMPESVQDRPTRSHEQVFLLTKKPRYFYDAEAVRETALSDPHAPGNKATGRLSEDGVSKHPDKLIGDGSRNLRTVWTISPKPFTEAHFATFPPDLVVPCIKAGTSEKGVCAVCGAPWRRIVEKEPIPEDVRADFEAARQRSAEDHGRGDGFTTRRPNFQRGRGPTTWEPTCVCHALGFEPDDFEIVESPMSDGGAIDPTRLTGRKGLNRERVENEGTRPMTRYEQRRYAEQLKASTARAEMECEAGETAFAHYVRTDRSGARPIPPDLLNAWIDRGWLWRVDPPAMPPAPDPIPATVLDPFSGAGTVGTVCAGLHRQYLGIEINPSYIEIAKRRIAAVAPLFTDTEIA